jgi:hypothetical protein
MATNDERKSKIADQMEQEMEDRDDERVQEDRAERENLNQGMDTGTHDSIHRGVKWGPSYRVRHKSTKTAEDAKQKE